MPLGALYPSKSGLMNKHIVNSLLLKHPLLELRHMTCILAIKSFAGTAE